MKRFFAGLLVFLLAASQQAYSAIAIDNTSSDLINGGSSLNVSHTTGSGSDRFMLVGISLWNADLETVTGVTYSGQNLTYVGARIQDNDSRVEIWKLVNPPVTTSDVRISFDGSVQNGAGAGVMTFTGVDQSTPHEVFQSNSGESGQATLTVTSETNDLVFAVAAAEEQDSSMSISLGDQRWNYRPNGRGKLTGAGATLAGATSTNFRWNLGDSDDWATAGVSINPASGGGGPLPSPILEYRFDECSLASGVTDSAGSYDGIANGSTESSDAEFLINRSLDLSATGTSDYVTLDSDSVNGLNGFSISTWIKTDTSKAQQEIFHALGSSQNDDEIEIYLENSTVVRMQVGDRGSTVSAGKTLTDDAWHHLVVTRSGSTMCLYVDGSLANCHSNGGGSQLSINNSSSVIIGQEQDSFGGSFDSSQAFEGFIDEFKVYDQVLSSTHVDDIYLNESNRDNADGSSRAAVNCSTFQWEGGSIDVAVGTTETINFNQTYTDPVIFLMAETDNPDPTAVRVVSIGTTSAQIVAVEPPDEDQSGSETVKFLVAEKGTYDLTGGVKIEVGEVDVSAVQHGSGVSGSESWQTINFSQSFSATPVLLTQIMSNNNDSGSYTSPWVYSATRNLDSSQFQSAIGRAEVGAGSVTLAESYAYLAVDEGAVPDFVNTGSGLTVTAEAIATGDTVTGDCRTISLTQSYSDPPDYVAVINSLDGGDGSWARGCDSTTTTVSVEVDEDTYRDGERSHTTEDVGVLVFGAAPEIVIPAAFAEWRFDESIWTGATSEIKDFLGNYDGSIVDTGSDNVINITDGKLCRAGQVGDNNSGGDQYAIDTTLDVDDDIGDQGSISFWYRSATTWGSNSERKVLLSASSTGSDDKYFFITMETDGRLRFGLENTSDADYRFSSSTAFSFAPTDWVHVTVTWDMSNASMKMYVNGVQEINETIGSTQSIGELLSIYLGDNRSDYTAGEGGRSADGDFDELLLFDEVISQTDVTTIYTNQDAGLNYDGTVRNCPSSPVAEWRFDEASWGTVEDNIGNNDGSASGDATTTSPGQICRAGEFDGDGDYVSGLDLSQLQTTASLSFWIKTSQTGSNSPWTAPGVTGVEQSGGADDIFWGWLDSSGRIGLTVGNDYNNTKSNTAINDGDWHHIVLTRNATDGAYQIFIDGSLDKSGTGGIGDIGNSFDLLGKIKSSSDELEGLLDEVLIFDEALSLAQVTAIHTNQLAGLNWDGTTRPDCVVGPDHYSISHSGNGVTCLSEQITITAHDASHAAIDAAQNTITITTDSGFGDWVSVVSGGESLINGTANDGEATVTFSSGSSAMVLEFRHTITGTFGFNITDGSVTETSGNAELADDPDISFKETIFRFLDSSDNVLLPIQIGGKASNLPPGGETLYLQALTESPDNPEECNALFASGERVDIEFAAECEASPTTCSGRAFSFTGNTTESIALSNGIPDGSNPSSFRPVQMLFGSDAKAPFSFTYNDVGKMKLHARFTGTDTGVSVQGSSEPFVVRPFALAFEQIEDSSGNANPGGDETGGSGFVSAGSDFIVQVQAYLYEPNDDDSVTDGHPDTDADYSNNTTAISFAEDVTISVDSFTPASRPQGTLNGNMVLAGADFSGGLADTTLQYMEVGSITLDAESTDYLDTGVNILSLPEKVGRFFPDYFELSGGSVTSGCGAFTYMQQPFNEVAYQIRALNTEGDVTTNYDALLYTVGRAEFILQAENNNDGNDLSSRVSYDDMTESLAFWNTGVASVALSTVTFERQGSGSGLEEAPLTSVQIGLKVDSEPDTRNLTGTNMDADSTSDPCGAGCDSVAIDAAPELRYGRLVIQSAHGPETQSLSVPFTTQYWGGNGFVTSTDDSCSQIPLTNINFDGNSIDTVGNRTVAVGGGHTTGSLNISGANAQSTAGDYNLEFTAPGAGNTGYFNIGINNVPLWLRYDWDQDGSADDSSMPDALITFGRARGNDRMIFWQERYQ
ncbi:MAG: DUF6701 domain-containing protein [Neptuniibacter sp.]